MKLYDWKTIDESPNWALQLFGEGDEPCDSYRIVNKRTKQWYQRNGYLPHNAKTKEQYEKLFADLNKECQEDTDYIETAIGRMQVPKEIKSWIKALVDSCTVSCPSGETAVISTRLESEILIKFPGYAYDGQDVVMESELVKLKTNS